jgi:hypothetical protein
MSRAKAPQRKLTVPRIRKAEKVAISLLDVGERLVFRLALLTVFGYELAHFLWTLFRG